MKCTENYCSSVGYKADMGLPTNNRKALVDELRRRIDEKYRRAHAAGLFHSAISFGDPRGNNPQAFDDTNRNQAKIDAARPPRRISSPEDRGHGTEDASAQLPRTRPQKRPQSGGDGKSHQERA